MNPREESVTTTDDYKRIKRAFGVAAPFRQVRFSCVEASVATQLGYM